jgi:hypothetical protein
VHVNDAIRKFNKDTAFILEIAVQDIFGLRTIEKDEIFADKPKAWTPKTLILAKLAPC